MVKNLIKKTKVNEVGLYVTNSFIWVLMIMDIVKCFGMWIATTKKQGRFFSAVQIVVKINEFA